MSSSAAASAAGGGDNGGGMKRAKTVNQHNSLMRLRDDSADEAKRRAADRQMRLSREDQVDALFGYTRVTSGKPQTGFVFNLRQVSVREEEKGEHELSAVEFYLVRDDGSTFKAVKIFSPYLLLRVQAGQSVSELEEWLGRKFDGLVAEVSLVKKEDLDLANHLSGLLQPYIKLSFRNTTDLMSVRRVLFPLVMANQRRAKAAAVYGVDLSDVNSGEAAARAGAAAAGDAVATAGDRRRRLDQITDTFLDIREYDVSFTQRVEIDTGLRVGLWYDVCPQSGTISCDFKERPDILGRPLMKVLAFDIETAKSPLKFPVADVDPVIMISCMLDGRGLLLVNRDIVSADIDDFEYTPKPEFEGPFRVTNCKGEKAMLEAFIAYIKEVKPLVFVTYNGDFFDWPFIDKRCTLHGISLYDEIAMSLDEISGEFKGRFAVHLDAFYWVKRDSYLPQGSHGLKAVTKAKLKYDPVELDPEDMLPFAIERPQVLASYSVSDAVATYYLYMKYIHLFIFSLCVIIPLSPDDVLRRGSGTLCEMLLMVKAFECNVVAPNKQIEQPLNFYEGHLLESETYIGGHVECLESGIFRTDLPVEFNLDAKRLQELIDNVENVIRFAAEVETGVSMDTIAPEVVARVRDDILQRLTGLRDKPQQMAAPLIYHLDVAAMYPNIILTNRLQPYAMVTPATCAACDFNTPDADCQRSLQWSWRGKYYVTSKADYAAIRASLEYEPLTAAEQEQFRARTFSDLKESDQAEKVKQRVKVYARKVYKRLTEEKVEPREATICQREHPFYIDTVRGFRDRRYEYKALNKTWGKKLAEATSALDVSACKDMILLYDSMQLAHKCILNSFYGYVMRKGARWCSMPMAGVVTKTGAKIIQCATDLVWAVGKPLELDTDGIWCLLPEQFPDNYTLESKDPVTGAVKKVFLNYPCSVLNRVVNLGFSNHQYQTLTDPAKRTYDKTSECSIMFEVDGPYRAMVLPASQHEGKNIKKRYAVFNKDGSLAELKGFEIKRRGELKLIKIFQGEVFKTFLLGESLQECYKHVGAVGDRWLDVLYSKGADLEDHDLFDLISENKSMSETLESYGDARSTSITCARRLGEFLGAEMVKDKGLNCHFIVSRMPLGAPVSERAVPVAIFSVEPAIKRHYLRKWLKDASLSDADLDIRKLLDWSYYITRLGSAIQKIITIPAAFQLVANPCPRVLHPDWLARALRRKNDRSKQTKLADYFTKGARDIEDDAAAAEDGADASTVAGATRVHRRVRRQGGGGDGAEGGIMADGDGEGEDDVSVISADGDGETAEHARARQFARSADPFGADDAAGAEGNAKAGSKSKQDKADFAAAALTLAGPKPDITKDYPGWLRWQQALWSKQRRERAARETSLFGQPLLQPTSRVKLGARGLRGFVEETERVQKTAHWHILEAMPSLTVPGLFDVWVLTGGRLELVSVVVPRTFYLNTVIANDMGEQSGKRVDRVLPRGRQCHFLYEITIPEAEYQAGWRDVQDLSHQPTVEGVYETQLPLEFSLVLTAGAVCVPKRLPGREAHEKRREFLLEQLVPYNAGDMSGTAAAAVSPHSPYLAEGHVNKLFYYHTRAGGRHLFGVLPSNGDKGLVVTVGAGAEKVNHRQMYQSVCESLGIPFDVTETPFNIAQQPAATVAAARDLVRAFLLRAKDEALAAADPSGAATGVPTIVLAQTPDSRAQLAADLPVLRTDFPVVLVPWDSEDERFPPLQWVPECSRRMYTQLIAATGWWRERLATAQRANVPVANLPSDHSLFALDVMYARALRQAGHLLWASPSGQPDVAGAELESNHFEDELANPELLNPGCFRSVCAELDVRHLALNAVIQHAAVEEAESGAGGAVAASLLAPTLSGTNAALSAFKVLRGVMSGMLQSFHATADADTEKLILHMYRWLHAGSQSLLYDPLLHAFVHRSMRKTFLQLVATLKALNCTIVYASFSRIIVATNKPTIARGVSFLVYVLRAVSDKGVFSCLGLTPGAMWESLLFLDACNYGGLRVVDHTTAAAEDGAEPAEAVTGLEYISNWNCGEYLPATARDALTDILYDFLLQPHDHMSEAAHTQTFSTGQERDDFLGAFVKGLVLQHLQRRLLALVGEVQRRHTSTQMQSLASALVAAARRRGAAAAADADAGIGEESKAADSGAFVARRFDQDIADTLCSTDFPVLPGSHLSLKNPALEFAKTVCHVLALDTMATDAVMVLKSNLLTKIGVRPFSEEAHWHNPCLTLVLPDVTCEHCNLSRDLDLCRDPGLFITDCDPAWRCSECQRPYDKPAVELALVSILQRRLTQYQVQDLVCVRCHDVKVSNIASSCKCSGVFQNSRSASAQRRQLFTLLNIARFHQFDRLRELVEWALMM